MFRSNKTLPTETKKKNIISKTLTQKFCFKSNSWIEMKIYKINKDWKWTWSLNQSVVFVEIVNDEASEVEKRRGRGWCARFYVGQSRFNKSDVLKKWRYIWWVDGFMFCRQAIEAKAESRLQNGVGWNLNKWLDVEGLCCSKLLQFINKTFRELKVKRSANNLEQIILPWGRSVIWWSEPNWQRGF